MKLWVLAILAAQGLISFMMEISFRHLSVEPGPRTAAEALSNGFERSASRTWRLGLLS